MRCLMLLVSSLLWISAAHAQSRPPNHRVKNAVNPPAAGLFGSQLLGVGDYDLDGVADYAVSAPAFAVSPGQLLGRVYVYSGRTSEEIISFDGDQPSTNFGMSLADVGDVNSNGYPDLAIGAPLHDEGAGNGGKVFVFDGLTGLEIWSFAGAELGGELGTNLGVYNNGGTLDLVTGQPGYSDLVIGGGRLVFLDGATGAYEGAATFDVGFQGFGGEIGTRRDSSRIFCSAGSGAVYEVSIPVGLVASFGLVHAADPTHPAYSKLLLLETSTGVHDLVVGRQFADVSGVIGAGRVDVYALGSITPKLSITGTVTTERVGSEITVVYDFDGDGDEELGVSSNDGLTAARVRVFDATGLVIDEVTGFPNLDNGLASIPDATGDGRGEWIASTEVSTEAMLFSAGLTQTSENTAGGVYTATFQIDAGAANAGAVYAQLYGVSGASPGLLASVDGVLIPLNLDAITTMMLVQAMKQTVVLPDAIGFLDGSGAASTSLLLPANVFSGQSLTTVAVIVPSPLDATVICATSPVQIDFP